jgi:class 3 adenylate cyclase/predicted ATPase
MSFLDTIRRARAYLEEQGRVSVRALKLEFGLDDDQLDALIEELVDIQQVGARQGKAVVWMGGTLQAGNAESTPHSAVPTPTPGGEAERRQLTVMFCELVDPSDPSHPLDAEDLRSGLQAFQQLASQPIERHEGRIAQYLGDGVLVYFGYPKAHEDDAERAVRAGLEILSGFRTSSESLERRMPFAARVGIHTGPVVIGAMGDGSKSQPLALGDTTNIAARLGAHGEIDSLVISDATLRLVPGMFLMNDLGTPPLEGVTEPIHAYAVVQATGVRSRLDVDPSKLTPFVGRDHELALLMERWERAQEGEGQGVLIAGEAGLGKSRLIHAFRERLAGTHHSWLECRCTPYTQGSALQPSIELVEQGLGFKPGDDSAMKLDRLERGMKRAGLSLSDTVPLIASMLSIPLANRYPPLQLSPELQRQKTMEALVAWTLGLAEHQPLVMLYEDLHWCDPSTVELLGLALEQGATSPVLTFLTFRPGFEPPWPARSHVTNVSVKRLTSRQTKNLIGGMTHDVPLPDAVVERVVERADGVPLFVEELTKMVLESGLVEEREGRYELSCTLTDLAIPATLQDSLMARLDRLDEGKEVAQLGAAIGREFFYPLLRSVSPLEESALQDALAQLVDAELLYQRGVLPEATFIFKHAMIQDTAYQSLLKGARRQIHSRIAQVLEKQFPDRVEAEPEALARHFHEAGLAAQAIAHYQRAGERAADRSANSEAIAHLGRALELTRTLPISLARNHQELGLQMAIGASLAAVRGWGDPECAGAFARARDLASQIGDVPELPRVLTGLSMAFNVKGDLAAAAELAHQALEASEGTHDAMHLLNAHYAAGHPLYWQGEFPRALEHFEQAIRLYDPAVHASHASEMGSDRGVNSRSFASIVRWMLGQPDQALATCNEALVLANQVQHPISLAQSLANMIVLHVVRREPARARQRADELIALAERLGFPMYLGIGTAGRGWARARSGEAEEGIAEIQQGLGVLAQTATGTGAPAFLAVLADGSWQVGRHDDALGALSVAVVRSQEKGQHFWDAELHRLRGEILLDRDYASSDEAESLFRQAIETARSQQAKGWELGSATSLARLWLRQDKRAEARELLAPVYASFTEGFDTHDLKDAKALLDALA